MLESAPPKEPETISSELQNIDLSFQDVQQRINAYVNRYGSGQEVPTKDLQQALANLEALLNKLENMTPSSQAEAGLKELLIGKVTTQKQRVWIIQGYQELRQKRNEVELNSKQMWNLSRNIQILFSTKRHWTAYTRSTSI